MWWGASRLTNLIAALRNRFAGVEYALPSGAAINDMRERASRHERALAAIEQASARMTGEQRQFFYEHVAFGLLIDYRPIQAALRLADALVDPSLSGAFIKAMEAFEYLRRLEEEIAKAERPPFEGWYRANMDPAVRLPGLARQQQHEPAQVVSGGPRLSDRHGWI